MIMLQRGENPSVPLQNQQRLIFCVLMVILYCLFFCLYSQLFGEEDADQEVSPDTADPEAACE